MSSSNTSIDRESLDPDSWEFELLVESYYDHAGIWEAVIIARDKAKSITTEEILTGLKRLLELGLIQAGYARGTEFEVWPGSAESIIARIREEWQALGHDPYLGDIGWLNSTQAGETLVKTLGR